MTADIISFVAVDVDIVVDFAFLPFFTLFSFRSFLTDEPVHV